MGAKAKILQTGMPKLDDTATERSAEHEKGLIKQTKAVLEVSKEALAGVDNVVKNIKMQDKGADAVSMAKSEIVQAVFAEHEKELEKHTNAVMEKSEEAIAGVDKAQEQLKQMTMTYRDLVKQAQAAKVAKSVAQSALDNIHAKQEADADFKKLVQQIADVKDQQGAVLNGEVKASVKGALEAEQAGAKAVLGKQARVKAARA